jgi:4-diphosphocytidyl-2-C-methyl-D-erythritol kinase
MPTPQTVTAPAKLTLSLRIIGVRPDGFHLIDAEMVSLDLCDQVVITPADDTRLAATGPYADGVPLDSTNLVARALELADRTADVTILKHIPHGGGLGGGSSDAAAVLRWAGWAPTPQALVLASTIGADVAYCLAGGRARVRGIGEIVDPLPAVALTVTLVVPPVQVSTPAVYQAWDHLGGPTADGPNDLEPALVHLYPELERWRDRIGDACGLPPTLAGSGASWFVPGEHEEALAAISDKERGSEGAKVIVATTIA